MAISDTSFFNEYQGIIGTTYARAYNQIYNPSETLVNFVDARQLMLQNFGTSEVATGLTVINAHLNSETVYTNASLDISDTVLSRLNTFFTQNYGSTLRDYYNATTAAKTVPWQNTFKEAWYQANTQELVQQIGFISWNGSNLVNYPATSTITNIQNSATVTNVYGVSSNYVTLSGFNSPITNFAMPGDIVVASTTGSIPDISSISLTTTVSGLANTNTIILSGPITSTTTTLFTFRPIKNVEYLEFRFGTSSVTGLAATTILTSIGLAVTFNTGVSTNVSLSTTNTYGRINLGTHTNTTYKALGISSITITSGAISGLGTQKALELWVKGTN